MDLRHYVESQQPETVRRQKFEDECKAVPAGHLNSWGVCRLWDTRAHEEWAKSPGKSARRLIAQLDLPLMEVGAGRYIVVHSIQGLDDVL